MSTGFGKLGSSAEARAERLDWYDWCAAQKDSPFAKFGPAGMETIRKMKVQLAAIKDSIFRLSYNPQLRNFSILNGSGFSKEYFQDKFDQTTYFRWVPMVTDNLDEQGNRIVVLKDVIIGPIDDDDVGKREYPKFQTMPELAVACRLVLGKMREMVDSIGQDSKGS